MKFLSFLVIAFGIGSLLSSCQKELNFETAAANGTLKSNSGGDCMPVAISGSYRKDSLITTADYIDISVQITTPGVYDIKTDTINGYSFHSMGTVADTGLHIIRLAGSGRPIAPSTDVFTIRFDTSRCEVNITVAGTGSTGSTAVFIFGAAGTVCSGAVLGPGTYISGLAADGNTVTLNVSVTQAGTYAIVTPTINGVIYSGHGVFTTATTTVTLTAIGITGTSATPVTSTYTVESGIPTAPDCSFDVTYAPTPTAASYTISCTGITVSGTYQTGTASNSSNFVTIPATSTGPGFYSITTDLQNGIRFSGNGTFIGAGAQNIILTPIPTGTIFAGAQGPFTYTFTPAGGTPCSFTVTYTAAAAPPVFHAKIDGVLTDFSSNANGEYIDIEDLLMRGDGTISPTAFSIEIDRGSGGGTVTTTTYVNSQQQSGAYSMIVIYDDLSGNGWSPAFTTPPDAFQVTISSLTTTRVAGTFFGTIRDLEGLGTNTKSVTEGVFDLPIN